MTSRGTRSSPRSQTPWGSTTRSTQIQDGLLTLLSPTTERLNRPVSRLSRAFYALYKTLLPRSMLTDSHRREFPNVPATPPRTRSFPDCYRSSTCVPLSTPGVPSFKETRIANSYP